LCTALKWLQTVLVKSFREYAYESLSSITTDVYVTSQANKNYQKRNLSLGLKLKQAKFIFEVNSGSIE
jgi:hypothetical protein